jgi:hypothetical protein
MTVMPIQLQSRTAIITEPEASAVRPGLTTQTKQFRPQDGRLLTAEPAMHHHFAEIAPDAVEIPIGLIHRANRLVRSRGIEPTFAGQYQIPSGQVANQEFCQRLGFPLAIRELSAALCTYCRGQILFEQAGNVRQVLATLIASYPEQRILIVGRRRRETRGLAGALTRAAGLRVFADHQAAFESNECRLVATTWLFEGANQDDWDIVVFLTPDALLGSLSLQTGRRLARYSQMYCLRPAHASLSQHEELLLESVVGQAIYVCPGPRGRLASVQVLQVDGPHKPVTGKFTDDTPAVELKRAFYWHNQHRNELIASLASAIRSQDATALIPHIPALRRTEALQLDLTDPCVCILVQNREHAQELHELLPSWPVISGNDQDCPDTCCIVTELVASRIDITSTFLINASGNELEHICFPAPVDEHHPVQTLLDFTDAFHQIAANRANLRLQAYRTALYDIHC